MQKKNPQTKTHTKAVMFFCPLKKAKQTTMKAKSPTEHKQHCMTKIKLKKFFAYTHTNIVKPLMQSDVFLSTKSFEIKNVVKQITREFKKPIK